MSTQIQFLRTDQVQLRPDPNILANGMPLLNFNEQEPGLFFKARDGSLFKVGPTAVGTIAPNTGANGYPGNTVGEMWLDTGLAVPMLKIYDGNDWVASSNPGGVSSVGLSMPSGLFEVENGPITSAGTLQVNLLPQVRNRVLAGPTDGSAQVPTFRALTGDDIPGLDGSKIVAGFVDQARIPSLDATKITSGVFNTARIPGIDATKIISGVLPYSFGGTGISTTPMAGELLIGGIATGWRKNTLSAGTGISIINGPGTIQIKSNPAGSAGAVQFNSGGLVAGSGNFTFDGSANILDLEGTLNVDGGIVLEYGTPASTLEFKSSTGLGVSLQAPGSVASALAFTLPSTIPTSSTDLLLKSSSSGALSLSDNIRVDVLAIRDNLSIENSSTGFSTTIRSATGLPADLTITLPQFIGGGGFVKTNSSGDLNVDANVACDIVTTPELIQQSNSPAREFNTGVASLAVSSDGTYTLLDIPADGSPASVNFTVFVHDEDAASGTGTLTVSYNAHYNGSAAMLSAAGNKVDSWTGTEPTFAVDYSGTNFRIRTTTASGSNDLIFMVNYTYVINVTPTT